MCFLWRLRQACPTDALTEKSVIELGMPSRTPVTTCAYCGSGVRSRRTSGAGTRHPGRPHDPVEGWRGQRGPLVRQGAASPMGMPPRHQDRIQRQPMVRDSIDRPWAGRLVGGGHRPHRRRLPQDSGERHGGAIGSISSSRCTNEEVFVVQKMVRAAFGNNNVDTCARVCHFADGLWPQPRLRHLGGHAGLRSVDAGRRHPADRRQPDRRHPVFASRMKRRLRAGARIIVADPRRIDLVRSPHVGRPTICPSGPERRLRQRDGACHRHRGTGGRRLPAGAADVFAYLAFIVRPDNSPERRPRRNRHTGR